VGGVLGLLGQGVEALELVLADAGDLDFDLVDVLGVAEGSRGAVEDREQADGTEDDENDPELAGERNHTREIDR